MNVRRRIGDRFMAWRTSALCLLNNIFGLKVAARRDGITCKTRILLAWLGGLWSAGGLLPLMLLKCCNMICSREQSKYPLSMLCHYMLAEVEEHRITGEGRPEGKLAISYDVLCKLSKTVKRSPLKNLAE
ncbi:hypothetical protein BT96DRAFT_651556 [Gymnopus androsaceus JB14]|uniref:Uncharacterized protein n=1 Tax=Gymnopus androsaceus JB14 TaxID=1447944 RepID=A0A6A4HQN9_9AGAR|nr:hypothetical protein BT96DRAFT_651556 [Gymnopus androsaceus JB14]